MRTRKSSERIRAEIMLRDYEENKRRIAQMEGEALHGRLPLPEVYRFSEGHRRDDTGRRVVLLSAVEKRRLEEEVAAVDYADSVCSSVPNGGKIAQIIDLVYKKGTHNLAGAAAIAGLASDVWAGKLAARYFGWVNEWFRL